MKLNHYKEVFSSRYDLVISRETIEGIKEGKLKDRETGQEFPILNFIPRFVPGESYTETFGFQWSQWSKSQLDSYVGLPISHNRIFENSIWPSDSPRQPQILELGSGAGRFTEILAPIASFLATCDLSRAIEVNRENNHDNENVLFVQGNLMNLPFEDNYFDFVLFFGVLQHCPDMNAALTSAFRHLKPGGLLSVDVYRSSIIPSPFRWPKYFWRPITKRLSLDTLSRIIQFYMPFWLKFDTRIRRIPILGPLMLSLIPIPCWNYLELGLSETQRLEWAMLDTFDALSPTYDQPLSRRRLAKMIEGLNPQDFTIHRGGNGLVANIQK